MANSKNLSSSPTQNSPGSKDKWPSGHRPEVLYTKNTKTRAIKSKLGWDSYGDALRHRLALQTEYPRAFLAIERQKKKVELDSAKVKEPSLDGFEILKDRAQQLATWFSSLDTTRQTSFVDQMLDDGPQPAGVMSGKAFRDCRR